jgi:hypothetical protein
MLTFFLLSIFGSLSLHGQTPDLVALAKVRTAVLVIHATTSISCGDGSEGTCVRNDSDVITKVKSIVDGTEIWQQFEKADATKADAIFEFTVTNATTTYARVEFSVRDADSNKILYGEIRSIVLLENDITRIVAHFLRAVQEAKNKPLNTKKH